MCQLPSIQHWPQLQDFLLSFAKQAPSAVARAAMHAAITGASSKHDTAVAVAVSYTVCLSNCNTMQLRVDTVAAFQHRRDVPPAHA